MKEGVLSIRFVETMLLVTVILMATMLYVSPADAGCEKDEEKITIKVVKHIVKGSGVTKDELKKWDDVAQEKWKCTFKFDVQYDGREAEKAGDDKVPWSADAVHVYGVSEAEGQAGEFAGETDNEQKIIRVAKNGGVPGGKAKDDTLAHEFGHFPGGDPRPLPEGDDHWQNDTNNLMYSGCARAKDCKATVTNKQQERARRFAKEWLKEANPHKSGSGTEKKDAANDTSKPFIDITYTDVWAQYNSLFLSITVDFFVNMSYLLGYIIESDNNASTGAPPLGIDYMVYFDPEMNHIYFLRYDTDWVPLDSEGISVKYVNEELDANVPVPTFPLEIITGIEFEIPLSLLTRRDGDIVSLVAFSQFESYSDRCPDEGSTSIQYIKEHDIAILSLTPAKTIVGVGNLMKIGVIVWNEGNSWESFSVSVFYNASLIGTSYVAAFPPGSETTLIFNWYTEGVPKGNYILSANATAVPGEVDLIDNAYEKWNTVQVTINGDINGDLIVDIFDIVTIALAFGAVSNDTNWWPNADVVLEFGLIDIFDLVSVAICFGNVDPP